MDELPREARRVLALAADAHDPPDGAARDRVRRGVAMAVAAAAGAGVAGTAVASAGGASSVAGKVATFGSAAKLWLAGGVLAIASATAVTVPRLVQKEPAAKTAVHRAHVAHKAPAVAAPAIEAPAVEAPVVEAPVVEAADGKRVRPVRSGPSPLEAEMALLRAASSALEKNELGRARSLLSQHRARFRKGQLAEEREGLSVLAACLAAEPGSVARARSFLRSQPAGVLATRIESACRSRR